MITLIASILLTATVILAFLTVEVPDLLYAVICLCGMSIIIGLLFGVLNAPYVMVFQFLIYSGATIALFLSIIMLTKRRDK